MTKYSSSNNRRIFVSKLFAMCRWGSHHLRAHKPCTTESNLFGLVCPANTSSHGNQFIL